MDPIAFACVSPHGWLLLPFIGGPASQKAHSSQVALEEVARRAARLSFDTLVIMTPHGLRVEDSFSLLDTPEVRGETGRVASLSGTPHTFSLQFDVDREFNEALREAGDAQGLPIHRVANSLPWEPLPLDFASTIPLWFLGASRFPAPKVVVVCAAGGLDWRIFPAFGSAVYQAAAKLGRRIGFIASADMGHAHDPNHEYGYDPASREFDLAVSSAIRANDLSSLLTYNPDWVRRAKTDAYGQLLALYGLLQEHPMRGELLSYEVPTYFGMLVAWWGQ